MRDVFQGQGHSRVAGISRFARQAGVVEQTLSNWIKAHKSGKLVADGRGSKLTAEQIEIRQLRADLVRVRMERDILGKAMAFCVLRRRPL